MNRFYYEIARDFEDIKKGIYVFTSDDFANDINAAPNFSAMGPAKLVYIADRVWKERPTGEVVYIKHRYEDRNIAVDMKEFLWIKLSANSLKKV